MGAAKQIKQIMKDKGIMLKDFAMMYNPESKAKAKVQVVSNMLTRDNLNFSTAVEMANILGCDIVFKDRETGKEYGADPNETRRYKYGMRLRGFAPMCQPMEGFVERQDDPKRKYHDILIYDRPLTKKELEDYELDNLN